MGKLIIDVREGQLRELFFGKWREEYEKFEKMDTPRGKMKKKSTQRRFISVGYPNGGKDKRISVR